MKEKHINNTKDNALFKEIYTKINQTIKFDTTHYYQVIWSKFAFYCVATIGLYIGILQIQNPIIFTIVFMAYGYAALLFAFNFAHDFSHNTIFKNNRWNNLGFIALYTLVGAHAEAWKDRHVNSHHFAPNVEKYDLDLQISSWIRVIPNSEYRSFHKYQHIYAPFAYMTYSLFWVFVKDFIHLFDKEENRDKGWKFYASFIAQKAFYLTYLLVLPILFSQHSWEMVLIAFLLMHLSQSLFLLFTFFMTHHVEGMLYPEVDENGYIQSSWLHNQIASSNDFFPFSETANFIFGGFNNHIAHHLFPHIHHIYYPKMNRILYDILRKHNVQPNQTTFFGGAMSHLKHLKQLSVT